MSLQLRRLFLSALILIMLSACSSSDEQGEKGRIEQKTDKIAKEAIQSIKTPIDQANAAKELTEQHNSVIKKNVEK